MLSAAKHLAVSVAQRFFASPHSEDVKCLTVKQYYVYIMTNKSRTLYTGVTNDLQRRVYEHKHKLVDGFTRKYNITVLVYYETFDDVLTAIAREKQIKGWVRTKKIALIQSVNPIWKDLSEGWYETNARDSSLRSE